MDLEEIRKQIDQLDSELLHVLSKRMALSPHIAEYKKQHNLPTCSPEREKQVLENKRKLAQELNLNPDFTEDIFKKIIEECKRLQEFSKDLNS
tara:strand:- start:91 stop:369 length:279 start_codon:yes stop_codon:yes gene_type:complete